MLTKAEKCKGSIWMNNGSFLTLYSSLGLNKHNCLKLVMLPMLLTSDPLMSHSWEPARNSLHFRLSRRRLSTLNRRYQL